MVAEDTMRITCDCVCGEARDLDLLYVCEADSGKRFVFGTMPYVKDYR